MVEPRMTVELSGPLFERDARLTVRENIRRMLEAIAAEGQEAVRSAFPVGGASDPHRGAGRAGVIGRVASLTGKRWELHAVVSAQYVYPWPRTGHGGTHIRSGRRLVANTAQAQYRGGKLERRVHMFGSVNRQLQSARAVLAANLSRGLE